MILGLILMIVVGAQSCAVYAGGSIGKSEAMAEGGAMGILLVLLFLVASAFVLVFPLVSLIVFSLAGIIGILAGTTTPFTDLVIWGIVAFVLAAFSFFGVREKRRTSASSATRVT